MALAAAVVALAWSTRFRWLAIVLAVPFVLLVGFSRLYIGVHYPSDILAGWITSLLWVRGVYALWNRFTVRHTLTRTPASQTEVLQTSP